MAIQFREGILNFPPTQTSVFFPGPVHSAQAARPLSWPSTGLGARKGRQLRSVPEQGAPCSGSRQIALVPLREVAVTGRSHARR